VKTVPLYKQIVLITSSFLFTVIYK